MPVTPVPSAPAIAAAVPLPTRNTRSDAWTFASTVYETASCALRSTASPVTASPMMRKSMGNPPPVTRVFRAGPWSSMRMSLVSSLRHKTLSRFELPSKSTT